MTADRLANRGLARPAEGYRDAHRRTHQSAHVLVLSAVLAALMAATVSADIVLDDFEPMLRLDLPGHTGEVRALAFSPESSRLISGGRDKLAIAWNLDADADVGPGPRLRDIVLARARGMTIRWQVARGPRGAVAAVAASPAGSPPVIAIGGQGAMNTSGEILLVDGRDGAWIKTLYGKTIDVPGHRQSVTQLEFTADGSWLVSLDADGQAYAWKRADDWRPVELAKREEERYGVEGARKLVALWPSRPLATLGKDRVALPELVSTADAAMPTWRIRVVDLSRPADRGRLLPFDLHAAVTALSATPDGSRLVAADATGRVVLLDPAAGRPAAVWEAKPTAESLAILPDGKRVAVGVAAGVETPSPPRIEIWDVSGKPAKVATRTVTAPVRALRASPDGRWLAWSGAVDHAVTLEKTSSLAQQEAGRPAGSFRRLGGVGQRITRVAFSTAAADARRLEEPAEKAPEGLRRRDIVIWKQQQAAADGRPPRRLAIARSGGDGQPAAGFDAAFDIEGLATTPVGDESDWAPAAGRPAGWQMRRDSRPTQQMEPGIERWETLRDGRRAGVIDLSIEWQGLAGAGGTAVSWLTRRGDAAPWAVAIGTDLGVFVYRLTEKPGEKCSLVRWFRGPENRVWSLAVSEDGRWLASGAGDGITMLWSLSRIDRSRPLFDRWGIEIKTENGRAVVESVDEAGPLVGRDVQVDDVIAKISYAANKTQGKSEHVNGDKIRTALADLPWNTSVVFTVVRAGQERTFIRNPAWENLAALHMAEDGEWAFWVPRGYYSASANGDRMFGWLANRGVEQVPRFFRANQFRRRLERPDVLSRLLIEGSLGAALRATARDVPESTSSLLKEQMEKTPKVGILDKRRVDAAEPGRLAVRAEISVPDGVQLDRVKANVSGVPATAPPRVVEEIPAVDGRPRRTVYEWDLFLPAQDRHLISVFASTREGPTDSAEADHYERMPRQPAKRRVHVITAGVGRYENVDRWLRIQRERGAKVDDDSWDLLFPAKDAQAIRDALSRRTLGVYELGSEPKLLTETAATRAGLQEAIATLSRNLRNTAGPDDIVVLFLSGHGLRNPDAAGAYAYLCHDADLLLSKSGKELIPTSIGAIAWSDLEPLADIPCRKLALVDTCHSGAFGPAGRSTSVREFQDNMFVVLAAAEDDQPSVEHERWGHGAFTKAVLEGLGAAPDDPGGNAKADVGGGSAGPDGVVTVDELIGYVKGRVPELTAEFVKPGWLDKCQTPKASPAALLNYVRPPLVKSALGAR